MNRKFGWIIIALLISCFIVACGDTRGTSSKKSNETLSSPTPIQNSGTSPDENALKSMVEEQLTNYTLDGQNNKSEITKFEIIRQKTDARTNTAVCSLELKDVHMTRKETITIISTFWDKGGWIMDSWEETEPEEYALSKVDEELVWNKVIDLGYHRDSLSIESKNNIKNGMQLCFNVNDTHPNLTATGKINGQITLNASDGFPKAYTWQVEIDESEMDFEWNLNRNLRPVSPEYGYTDWICEFVPGNSQKRPVLGVFSINRVSEPYQDGTGTTFVLIKGEVSFFRQKYSGSEADETVWESSSSVEEYAVENYSYDVEKLRKFKWTDERDWNSDDLHGLFKVEGTSLSTIHLVQDTIMFDGNDFQNRIALFFYPDNACIKTHNYYDGKAYYDDSVTKPLVPCKWESANTNTKTYDITVWCPEAICELTRNQIKAFNKTNRLGIAFNANISPVSEAEAASMMITSVDDGADLFFFASDLFQKLVQAKALARPDRSAIQTVKDNNVEDSVKAITADGVPYAYPCAADNGFFLYYDKSVLSSADVKSMERIISKCEAANKTIAYNVTNVWYGVSYFFGTGCISEWITDDKGKTIGVNDDFCSDKGLIAAKGMYELTSSRAFVDTADAYATFSTGAAAVISGPWDYKKAKELLGDNLGATKLPTFTVDGKTYQMGSFSGYKNIGVRPQYSTERESALQELALYLTNETCQAERFYALSWLPSNKETGNMDAIKSNIVYKALTEQGPYSVTQLSAIADKWWDIGNSLGKEISKCDGSETALQAALDFYKANLELIFNMSDDIKNAFTVIGTIGGTLWDKDFEMTKDGDVWTSKQAFQLKKGDELRVRKGLSWDVNYGSYGGENFVVDAAGTYYIVFNEKTKIITLVKEQ